MVGGILYEHGHRMIAATVATLVGLQILVLGFGRTDRTTFRLGLAAFGAILGQAVLGGLTVLFLLPPAVSSSHAGLAQIVFALTATIALRTSLFWGRFSAEAPRAAVDPAALAGASRLALLAAGASYVQILLGAIVRHTGAGLAIPDWPLSFGRLVAGRRRVGRAGRPRPVRPPDLRLGRRRRSSSRRRSRSGSSGASPAFGRAADALARPPRRPGRRSAPPPSGPRRPSPSPPRTSPSAASSGSPASSRRSSSRA